MYKTLVIILVIFLGCIDNKEQLTSQQKTIDSLKSVIGLYKDSCWTKDNDYYLLKSKASEQKILIRFTAEKCKRYAKIVKNDPTQSTFIVAWIDRSFQWIDQ